MKSLLTAELIVTVSKGVHVEGLLGPLSHDGHCTLEGTLSP